MRVRVWEGGREREKEKEEGIVVAVCGKCECKFECDWMCRGWEGGVKLCGGAGVAAFLELRRGEERRSILVEATDARSWWEGL